MSIVVTSNTPAVQADAPAGESVETKSAPEVKETAEQTKSSDTGTEENEAEESEADKDDAEADGDELEAKDDSEKVKTKTKSGSQRRKERAERAEAEVTRLQGLMETMALKGAGDTKTESKEAQAAKVNDAGKPIPETFETHAEYVEALTDWKIEQREQAKIANDHKAKIETEHQTLMKSHSDRVKAFKEKTADFDDVMETVDDVPVSPTISGIIFSSENGADLMYALAKNRAEFERINTLSPIAAAREIGKIEAALSASGASEAKNTEPKKQTKAPAPIVPVGSKGGSVSKSIEEIAATGTQSEYEAARAKQLAARKSAW